MRLKFLLSFTLLLSGVVSFAQKIGTWETHFSYTNTIDQIVQAEDRLYVLTGGKLFAYYPDDDYLETYSRGDKGNSDIEKIQYNEKNEALIVFRENYDIDILYSNGEFVNIPYLKDATQNIDKRLNNIYCIDDLAYLSTNFGILVINVAREEIKEVGLFNKQFYSTCIFDDYLYAATEIGVIRLATGKNMQDLNDWESFDVLSRCDEKDFSVSDISWLFQFRDRLCILVKDKRIYSWNMQTDKMEVLDPYGPRYMDYISNERIITSRWGEVWIFDQKSSDFFRIPKNTDETNQAVAPKKGKSDEFWIGAPGHYLSLVKKVENSSEFLLDSKIPEGPWSNSPFSMKHQYGKLLVTGGGYYRNRFDNPGYLSLYAKGKWDLYDPKEVNSKFGVSPRDYVSAITDPFNKNRVFVSSWGDGIYEFIDGKPVNMFTPENTSGILQDIFLNKDFTRVGEMSFDKSGNLWLTNSMVTAPIKVLMKNGSWEQIRHKEIGVSAKELGDAIKDVTEITGIKVDRYDKKWIYSVRNNPYLFILDDNKTPSDTLDDKKRYVNRFIDQDNKVINVDVIYDLQEDLKGNMWVATNAGPYVIYGVRNVLRTDIKGNFTTKEVILNKIKIPRNDGTNNVDILLEGTDIKVLAIDGANRKWLGTPYGAYLISETGQETIHHFNMDNSPMPSNEVISLAIDPENGTVYIGTDKGIVSFVGDAIEGKSDYSNVYAFPNPVRPDYEGVITITGLQSNSNVKITDVRGNILNQGTSLGGQYTWDGRTPSGNKVDTGVYLVFGATEDGKSGVVTKILVVK